MKLPRIIVTRPRLEAEQWVAALAAEGFAGQALPLIDIAALPRSGALPRAGDHDALMFVSSNAVRHFFAEKGLFSEPNRVLPNQIGREQLLKT